MQLRTQIIGFILPLIVAPLLILGGFAHEQLRNSAEQALLSQLLSERQKITLQSRAIIGAMEEDLEVLATFSVVRRYFRNDDEETRHALILPSLLKLFRTFQNTHPNYYEIKVLWNDGSEDARSARDDIPNAAQKEADSELFVSLSHTEDAILTRFLRNPDTHTMALTAGKPMRLTPAAPDVRGYLVMTSDLKAFANIILQAKVGDTGMFFITDNQGTILHHPNADQIGKFLPPQYFQAFVAKTSKKHTLTLNDGDKDVYVTHTTLQDKLHLFGQLSAEEVFAASTTLSAVVIIIIIGATTLTSALVFVVLNYTLITPIHRLGKAVSNLQNGVFDTRLDIASNNELGQLARAFECMSQDLQTSHNRIHHLAYYDDLTHLPNRTMFKNELTRTLAYASRRDLNFGLIFVDIDNFKRVNDLFGHHAGDDMMLTIAERLQHSLRAEDLIALSDPNHSRGDADPDHRETSTALLARLGGDEFTVLLPNLPTTMAARAVAQRIIDTLSRPILIEDEELFVGASIGIAMFPDDGKDAATLLRNADIAMYHAKTSGKNRMQFFGEAINQTATLRHDLEGRLRKAIQSNALSIHYQPLIDLANGCTLGAEALLRWEDPDHGCVSPEQFIPIAEESGLIIELGEWVLRQTCRQLQRWRQAGLCEMFIAVNISGIQITRGDLDQVVCSILRETGLPPELLCLEVTETSVVSAIERAQHVLEGIQAHGVKIALDDFGTGYSSLSYLQRLPIDHLKIDRSFIADITEDVEDETIIAAIIAMGQNLGIEIVAEGIETPEQLAFLSHNGCEMGQGYLFSKPLPPAEFIQRFGSQNAPETNARTDRPERRKSM